MMTSEQKAAYIMAMAAVLNAKIAGMVAANESDRAAGRLISFGIHDFEQAAEESGCHHNAVCQFFQD